MMDNNSYHPNDYWTKVAAKINSRGLKNYLAGDDEPFYRYKRKKFLKLLLHIDFSNKQVLEVGCGPGGNLEEILKSNPSTLAGVDISQEMVDLAKKNLEGKNFEILKIDGTSFPFESNSKDIVLTATVLQHNTDPKMLADLIVEICRVSSKQVILFERIEKKPKGDELCQGRTVTFYEEILKKSNFGLIEVKYLPISISYYICGAIRKIFNKKGRKEGDPVSKLSIILQKITLPLTSLMDKIYIQKRDVAQLTFIKIEVS